MCRFRSARQESLWGFFRPSHVLRLFWQVRPLKANATGAMTDMEDFFTPTTLATLLDGKPFDRTKKHGDATAYGEALFAERVVKSGVERIDFSGFVPLLEAVAEIINDYAAEGCSSGAGM